MSELMKTSFFVIFSHTMLIVQYCSWNLQNCIADLKNIKKYFKIPYLKSGILIGVVMFLILRRSINNSRWPILNLIRTFELIDLQQTYISTKCKWNKFQHKTIINQWLKYITRFSRDSYWNPILHLNQWFDPLLHCLETKRKKRKCN